MKAVIIEKYGGKEELKMSQVPNPVIKENEVLIEMHATSINPIDWKVREGYLKDMMPLPFPIVLGWDAAGIVESIGKKVTAFKIGDRVFARPHTSPNGTYSEYISVPEDLVVKIPENISFEEAASIPLAGMTAWQALVNFGKIKQGDKVLIHAGAGGVGSLAIQIAKSLGAYVATTGSSKNEDLLKSLGADIVINYEKNNFENEIKDYDIVFDTMGGKIQENSYKVLKKGGILVSIVEAPDQDKAKEYGVTAMVFMLETNGSDLKKLAETLKSGKLKPLVGHSFRI